MTRCIRALLGWTTTLLGVAASPIVSANTWDFSGVVATCNPLACGIAAIEPGDQFIGFLKAIDAASGPDQIFGPAAVTDYLLLSGGINVGPDNSDVDSGSLTTDAADEIVSGVIVFSGTFDGGIFGPIDITFNLDASNATWTAETPFLGLGVVATGTGAFAHEPDGDDRAAIEDNCTLEANADQRDTDGDGFGNVCDADFTNDCAVNFADLAVMKGAFLEPSTTDTDMDGDGNTNYTDLGELKARFFAAPGPSGVLNICSL
jgi:hypothetical protein